MSFSQTILVGRLVADPEVKTTKSGKAVCRVSMATDRFVGGQKKAEFHSVIVWEKQAEALGQHCSKGSLIQVIGENQTTHFQNNEGKKVYRTDVVARKVNFLSPRNSGQQNASQGQEPSSLGNFPGPEPTFDANEEIPF